MKYILFVDSNGQRLPVIFPETLVHADVAKTLIRGLEHPVPIHVLTAGFVAIPGAVVTHGKSDSLDVSSRESDAAYIMLGSAASYMPAEALVPMLNKLRELGKK